LNDTPLAEDSDDPLGLALWALNDNWRSITDRLIDTYTQAEVDALLAAENFWDRSGTTIQPENAGDDLNMGTGDIYGANFYPTNNTNYNAAKGPYWDSGNAYIQHTAGNLTVLTNNGDMYLRASSGDMDFHDQHLSAPIDLSEAGETGWDPFFSKASIVGCINELANTITGAVWKSVGSEIEPYVLNENLNMKNGWIRTDDNLSFGTDIDFDFTAGTPDALDIDGGGSNLTFTAWNSIIAYAGAGTSQGNIEWDSSGFVNFKWGATELAGVKSASSFVFGDDIDVEFGVTTDGKITWNNTGGAWEFVTTGDMTLKDQYLTAGLALSESGETGLTGFTATSIVGALNEVRADVTAEDIWDRAATTVSAKNAGDTIDFSNTAYVDFTGTTIWSGGSRLSDAAGTTTWAGNGDDLVFNAWVNIDISATTLDLVTTGAMTFDDQYTTSPIALSETGETAFDTTSQSIVGAVNEVYGMVGSTIWQRVSTTISPLNNGDTLDLTGDILKFGASTLSDSGGTNTWDYAGDALFIKNFNQLDIGDGVGDGIITLNSSSNIYMKVGGVTVWENVGTTALFPRDVSFGSGTDILYDYASNFMRFADDVQLTFGCDYRVDWCQ
jgi:hypothetical protein